jgi:hypothetical protein
MKKKKLTKQQQAVLQLRHKLYDLVNDAPEIKDYNKLQMVLDALANTTAMVIHMYADAIYRPALLGEFMKVTNQCLELFDEEIKAKNA